MNQPVVSEYDVLIVGARIAGASLALLLGQRGHRVLMVDRSRFPSDTMSTHFMVPWSIPMLAQLGVLEDVEAGGFRRITRARTYLEDCIVEAPIAPGGGYSLAPRRDHIDSVLIDHAVKRGGVTFWEQSRADGLIEDDGRVVGARITTRGGTTTDVRARVVVGADGKYSKVAEWVNAPEYETVPAMRPAYYGYYRGVEPLPEPTLEIFFVGDRISFDFPMQPGMDCVAVEMRPGDFDEFRTDPKTAFEAYFRTLPTMASRFANAQLDGKMIGVRGINNYFRKPYGPGWALTGDAGYLKDPSTGLGMSDALGQAFWLADALDAALDGADWDSTLGGFQQKRDAELMPLYQLTLWFTQMADAPSSSLAWLRAMLASPILARYLPFALSGFISQALPPHLTPMLNDLATGFGATPSPEQGIAADD